MPLVTFSAILPQARLAKRAVAAFNVANMETVLAVFRAAEHERSPVIIQVYQRLFADERAALIAAMTRQLADASDIPVALHLDHGESLDQLRQALRLGYTSVMIDGSKRPFAENIALTAEAARIAHDAGATLEAEIGHVPFGDGEIELSTAAEAEAFVAQTGVDALAISIGTVHGFYKREPELDIARAAEIAARVPIPLVLHGGTGVPAAQLRQAVACGVAKVNIATELQSLFLKRAAAELAACGEKFRPVDLCLKPVEADVQTYVRDKIRSLNGID